jgi:hypothetical protein
MAASKKTDGTRQKIRKEKLSRRKQRQEKKEKKNKRFFEIINKLQERKVDLN